MAAYEGVQKLAHTVEPRAQSCIASAHGVALCNRTELRVDGHTAAGAAAGTSYLCRPWCNRRVIFETLGESEKQSRWLRGCQRLRVGVGDCFLELHPLTGLTCDHGVVSFSCTGLQS